MTPLKLLLACAVLASGAAAADPAPDLLVAERSPLPPHPSLYSFADVVRLTLGAAAPAGPAAPPAPLRVTSVQPAAAEPRFSIEPVREPGRWRLLVSGLALAGWVARRRLVNAL